MKKALQHREALAFATSLARFERDPEVGNILAARVSLPGEADIRFAPAASAQHRYPELVAKRRAIALAVLVLSEVHRGRTTIVDARRAVVEASDDPHTLPSSASVLVCAARRRLCLPTIRPKG